MKTYLTLEEVLQKVVGAPLSSVDFVEDYVQLSWDRSLLTAYSWPTIVKKSTTYTNHDAEYRSEMNRLEGQIVKVVEVLDKAVNIFFAGKTMLIISMKEVDYVGPEILLYQEKDGLLWVV